MSDILKNLNIYFDEVDKIRVLDPEVSLKTNDLKDECKIYVESDYMNKIVIFIFINNFLF